MKLTIIAPEMVYEHEVDSSMQVQDIIALVEAEVSVLVRADVAWPVGAQIGAID
jgi:hypothetical protein